MIRILFVVLCALIAWFPNLIGFSPIKTDAATAAASTQAAVSPAATTTPARTPMPTLDPAATPWMSEDDTNALNQSINDFLNKDGDYTPEKISEMMFDLSGLFDLSQIQLGIVDATRIEGFLLNYIEKDDSLVLLVGFDGVDGERFVAPIQIPLYYIEGDLYSHFYFMEFHADSGYALKVADITMRNTADLNRYLYERIGTCIAVAPARIALSGSPNGYMGAVFDYFAEHNTKLPLAEKLMLSVVTNEDHVAVPSTFPQLYDVMHGFDEKALEGVLIPHITCLEDIGRLDMTLVPMIDPVIIYLK